MNTQTHKHTNIQKHQHTTTQPHSHANIQTRCELFLDRRVRSRRHAAERYTRRGREAAEYTQLSPVALYTCVLRYEEMFATSFELISVSVICIKGNLYIVRRANSEYICIYVH